MNYIAGLLDDRDCRVYVACTENAVVGFSIVLVAEDGDRPFGVLNDILVRADHRKRGIGRELLAKSVGWLRKKGITDCYLESGRENHGAHDFFAKYGFVQVSHTFHKRITEKPL